MEWVIVNYSVKSKDETFDVNEFEEKNKKRKNIFSLERVVPYLGNIFFLLRQIYARPKPRQKIFEGTT